MSTPSLSEDTFSNYNILGDTGLIYWAPQDTQYEKFSSELVRINGTAFPSRQFVLTPSFPPEITCRTTNNSGACVNPSDQYVGVLFQDYFFLELSQPDKKLSYSKWDTITAGSLSYEGNLYTIHNGNLFNSAGAHVGYILLWGEMVLESGNRTFWGYYTDIPGVAAELYIGNEKFYDSLPAEGIIETAQGSYSVDQSLVFNLTDKTTESRPVGSVNSRGEISWSEGSMTNLSKLSTARAILADAGRGDVLRIDRQDEITQEFRNHVQIIYEKNNSSLSVLGYTFSYQTPDVIEVFVRIKPLSHPSANLSKEELKNLENELNEALRIKLENRYQFIDSENQAYRIQFKVAFVEDQSHDAEMRLFKDNSPKCTGTDNLSSPPYPTRLCHTVQPTTHQLSVETARRDFPHEFLHFLGNKDTYPDTKDPERKITDSSDLMYDYEGDLRPEHLDDVLGIALRAINGALRITPILQSFEE